MKKQNDPRQTELVSISELTALASQLENWAKETREAIEVAEKTDQSGLACFYWASAELGLKRIRSFMNALQESKFASQMGKPLESGQLKPRSTAKKSKKEIEAMVDEDLEKLESHRASKKKKSQ